MATLADIKQRGNIISGGTEEGVPKGTFFVFAEVLGVLTYYLLRGNFEHETAVILGRIETYPTTSSAAYKGDGLKGGSFFLPKGSFQDTFAEMV